MAVRSRVRYIARCDSNTKRIVIKRLKHVDWGVLFGQNRRRKSSFANYLEPPQIVFSDKAHGLGFAIFFTFAPLLLVTCHWWVLNRRKSVGEGCKAAPHLSQGIGGGRLQLRANA